MKTLCVTPLKNGMSGKFLTGLIPTLRQTEIEFRTIQGPCVNFARNDAAQMAVDEGFDALLQIDEDIRWTPQQAARICSHSAAIVSGCYRQKGGSDWLHEPEEDGDQMSLDGLQPCRWVPTGFLFTTTAALRRIRDANPDRWYDHREKSAEATPPRMEWFPMGVVGPGSASARLDRVKGILSLLPRMQTQGYIPGAALEKIREAVECVEKPGRLLGEDYYFCELAHRAGVSIYADTKCILEHAT